jgi:DNA uptake protein ComE-like DNA-binding protein
MSIPRLLCSAFLSVVLVGLTASAGTAQVGKSLGVVDANTATEAELTAAPHMTPAIVKALMAARPFASIVDLNTFLLGQKLTQEQAMAFYGKAFVHINLNTATREEILLVPGAGNRMAREFAESARGRPGAVRQGDQQAVGQRPQAEAVRPSRST